MKYSAREDLMIRGLIGFIGRLCISLIFIASGLEKILNWGKAEETLRMTIGHWAQPGSGMLWAQGFSADLISHLPALLSLCVALELLGAICILLGCYVRLGALLLIIFLVPVTLLMHPFWTVQGPEYDLEVATFLRNLSIIGGLLILLAYYGTKEKSTG